MGLVAAGKLLANPKTGKHTVFLKLVTRWKPHSLPTMARNFLAIIGSLLTFPTWSNATMDKIYNYKSLQDSLSFAESLGWEDDWENSDTDTLEDSAIEHIEASGYVINYPV